MKIWKWKWKLHVEIFHINSNSFNLRPINIVNLLKIQIFYPNERKIIKNEEEKRTYSCMKIFGFFPPFFFLFPCNIIPSCITREFYAWLLQKFVKKRLIYSNEICGYSYKMIIYRIIDIYKYSMFHSNTSLKKFQVSLSIILFSLFLQILFIFSSLV